MIAVEIVLKNEATAKKLCKAYQLVVEASEDYEWSDDLKEAKELIEDVMENMAFISHSRQSGSKGNRRLGSQNGLSLVALLPDGLLYLLFLSSAVL